MSRSLTRAEGPAIQSIDSSSYLGGRYLRKRTGDFSDTTLSAKLGSILVNHLALLQPHVSGIDVDTTLQRHIHRVGCFFITVIVRLVTSAQYLVI